MVKTTPPESLNEWIVAPPLALELSWEDGRLARIRLDRDHGHAQTPDLSPKGREMAEALARYVSGREPRWPDLGIDFTGLPPFTAKVLETLSGQVKHGQTVSYGLLAELSGSPRAARAVGQALARNPWPLVVPCHRVLGAQGGLTGYTNPSGVALKQELLTLETPNR